MILSVIIIIVVIGLMNYQGNTKLRKVNKLDFLACMAAFFCILLVFIQNGPHNEKDDEIEEDEPSAKRKKGCGSKVDKLKKKSGSQKMLVLANPVGSITERLFNLVVGKTFGSDHVFFNVAKAIAAAPHKAQP
ncbi:hypothetical protein E2562_000129 [Oryza meyeriana var. granulata]|uniref:Uncharacterized protein n=1 Tax=Oryza meyeriana var. granulata TaxID=110450 RepID=A0A6G1DBK9_9ORYZ|nr:hypothetical protein E2562_000129 [Oryza meyeriana var. granulata]